jgi:hypothetical protein
LSELKDGVGEVLLVSSLSPECEGYESKQVGLFLFFFACPKKKQKKAAGNNDSLFPAGIPIKL